MTRSMTNAPPQSRTRNASPAERSFATASPSLVYPSPETGLPELPVGVLPEVDPNVPDDDELEAVDRELPEPNNEPPEELELDDVDPDRKLPEELELEELDPERELPEELDELEPERELPEEPPKL
jgi:hypothetical protein